ncbi:hypothetical protein NDS46_31680 (plasmid) [Paenibacillus thiaminolyticus]|uniref:hypothetical protein n=1 Tax=Paenibacillus thiaminolyticus TaxID=49283 RepID=UPI00232DB2F4|nr:hypothetical protein [Paenibacillus thiaminolyticus]WCF11520.1 hypothetical protein NDS46_31680 [Paenibacillus thiaminolyticus]
MKLESLFDTNEQLDDLFTQLNKAENKLVKKAFWALWEDRNDVIAAWDKLHKQHVKNTFK